MEQMLKLMEENVGDNNKHFYYKSDYFINPKRLAVIRGVDPKPSGILRYSLPLKEVNREKRNVMMMMT